MSDVQWNLSNSTHQRTRAMCRILQDVGILRFYFIYQKYFGTIYFCRMSQDVGKLRCRIPQIPLYIILSKTYRCIFILLHMSPQLNFSLCSFFSLWSCFSLWYFDIVYFLTKFLTQGAGKTYICVNTCWSLYVILSTSGY